MDWDEYRRACYWLARDEKEFIEDGSFNVRAGELIDIGKRLGGDDAISFMENMISLGSEFERADLEFAPILVYKAESICCDVLNFFADRLAEALRRRGETVQIVDMRDTQPGELTMLCGKRFKAMIGVQSYVFSIKFKDGGNLHDSIKGPKFNMFLDHPTCLNSHLLNAPKDFYVLTHDRNYASHVRKFYPNIKGCFILPPGGETYTPVENINTQTADSTDSHTDSHTGNQTGCTDATCFNIEKIYDLTFIGAYHNPQDMLLNVKRLDEKYDGKASVLAQSMIDNPDATYESQVQRVFGDLTPTDYYELVATFYCASTYYREKIIRTILNAGLTLHVFGDSWNTPELRAYPNLIIHPEAAGDDALKLYAQSKISLNIMTWHKDGMTERIANTMMNHAVVLTDTSTYLTEHFKDGKEIVFYRLTQLDELPNKIRRLLTDDDYRESIAENGYKAAAAHDTWDNRAGEFLKILDNINREE
jgi:hypothetical protein